MEAGGDDHGPHLVLLDPLLLVEPEGVPFAAGFDAPLLAFAAGDLQADFGINDGNRRHRLGERNPHRLPQAEALVEGVGELGPRERAAIDALHAADAEALVDIPRLPLDLDAEVAHRPLYRFHRGISEQLDVRVELDGGHLGREDAGGAVQGGNVLSNIAMCPPIDGSRSTRITSRPASASVNAAWMPAMPPPTTIARGTIRTNCRCKGRAGRRGKRPLRGGFGLFQRLLPILGNPGHLFADIGDLHQEPVQTGVFRARRNVAS